MTKQLFIPKYKPVNRYTRAGYYGKNIKCPKCQSVNKVYHFSWSACGCLDCKEIVNKLDWLVESN